MRPSRPSRTSTPHHVGKPLCQPIPGNYSRVTILPTQSLRQHSARLFSSNNSTSSNPSDASATPLHERTIPISKIPKEVLLERPELALRAHFNRIPTREEVTGLTPDLERDEIPFKMSGQQELNYDSMRLPPEDPYADRLTRLEQKEQLKYAIENSPSPLSQSILGLTIVEPRPAPVGAVLDALESTVVDKLNTAPVPIPQGDSTRLKELREYQHNQITQEISDSKTVYRGELPKIKGVLTRNLEDLKKVAPDYFEPTGNVEIDKMNEENLKRGLTPMPDFTQDLKDITPRDIVEIDNLAQQLVDSVMVRTSAKQPFDTASKVVRERLRDLPSDAKTFFSQAGMHTVESRTVIGYSRYLRLLSVKGSITQMMSIWNEIKDRGITLTPQLYLELIGCCSIPSRSPQEEKMLIDEMMKNKPDVGYAFNYTRMPDYVTTTTVLPKTTNTPFGAPKGFVSVAPQIATYGSGRFRTRFNPNVEFAFYLFEKARKSNIVPSRELFTQVMRVCGDHKQYERAFALYEEFLRYGAGEYEDPKHSMTYTTHLITKDLQQAKLIGYEADKVMATTLMHGLYKCKQSFLCEDVFHKFWTQGLQPDAPMYNLVIRAIAETDHIERAFKYFNQMQHFGFTPSIVTYTSLIKACAHPDRPEFYPKAFELFHECVAAGFRPNDQLFMVLLGASAKQGDLNNLITIFRLVLNQFPHLLTTNVYTKMLEGIANTMSNKKLPGFGGYVLIEGTSRSIFGDAQIDSNDNREKALAANQEINAGKKLKITREDRIVMAESVFNEFILRLEQQDSIGSKHNHQLVLDTVLINRLIDVYAQAVSGILQYDRHEREEGREDPMLRLTEKHVEQMIERTWNKVTALQQQHPHVFKLDGQTYLSLFDMYGAADMLEDAVKHLFYLTRGLKLDVPYTVFTKLLKWAKQNRHSGAALAIIDEMKAQGYRVDLSEQQYFENRDRNVDRPIPTPSYPMENAHLYREQRFQNTYRDKRTGKVRQHPLDFDVSYKDW